MRYSRTGVIAVLLAAEVFVGGAIIWTMTGGGWSAQAAGLHRVSEQGKSYAPIEAGNAPHVVIDDPASRVVIAASTDGKVHITDATRHEGWFLGQPAHPGLTIERTPDGVSVSRGSSTDGIGFIGIDFQHTDVAVPPNAFVDVRHCGGADVSGLAGQVRIHCGDGSIHGHDLRVTGGAMRTDDGSIHLAFADANLAVRAQTGDGSIRFNGRRAAQDDDSGAADYHVGTGGGSLQVSTQDGSIHISTNGAL